LIRALAEFSIQSMSVMVLAQQSVVPIYAWSLLLIALLIGGFVVVLLVRRRATGGDAEAPQTFSLSELRQMRDSGQITAEQYEKLREAVIAGMKNPR